MNKKINFISAIGIIVLCSLLVGTVVILATIQIKDKSVSLEVPESKNETAGWKIYKNEEVGYQIKYPSNWFLKREELMELGYKWDEDTLDQISIENLEDTLVVYTAAYIPDGQAFLSVRVKAIDYSSVEEWIDSLDIPQKTKEERWFSFVEPLKIGGKTLSALVRMDVVVDGNVHIKGVYFVSDKKLYIINYEQYLLEEENKGILDKILSTFRFID